MSEGQNKGGGSGKSGPNKSRNNSSNRKRNYNRKRRSNSANKGQGSSGSSSSNNLNSSGSKSNSSGNKKRYNNKRSRNNRSKAHAKEYRGGDPRNLGPNKIVMHYDYLLELHVQARQKYYELFFRANPQQKEKLEKKFNATREALREFEEMMKPEHKEILKKRIDGNPQDHIYCENHGIDPTACDPLPTEIENIHMNDIQKSRPDYSEDTEESEGSMEDYYKFKGLPTPEPKKEEEKPSKKQ